MDEQKRVEALDKVSKQINDIDLKIARLQIARDNLFKRHQRLQQKPQEPKAPTAEEREKQSQAARKRQAELMTEKLRSAGYKAEAAKRLSFLDLEKKSKVQKDEKKDPT